MISCWLLSCLGLQLFSHFFLSLLSCPQSWCPMSDDKLFPILSSSFSWSPSSFSSFSSSSFLLMVASCNLRQFSFLFRLLCFYSFLYSSPICVDTFCCSTLPYVHQKIVAFLVFCIIFTKIWSYLSNFLFVF